MPDQHDRAVDGLDHAADDAGVEGNASQWVRRGERRVAGTLKLADHSREPGCVGEGAVDEDDGGTRHGRFSSGWRGAPTTLRHRTRAPARGSPPGTQPVVLCRSTAMRPPPASRTSRQQGRLKTGSSAWPVTSHEIADSECACNDDHPPAPAMRARWRPGCVAADQATRAQVPLQGPLGRRHARTRRGRRRVRRNGYCRSSPSHPARRKRAQAGCHDRYQPRLIAVPRRMSAPYAGSSSTDC